MSDQAELAFIKTFASNLSTIPVNYPDDYQQPPSNWLKKVPTVPVEVPAPPERKTQSTASTSSTISVTIKSVKPPATFTLTVSPADAISSVKSQLAQQPRGPPADAQRLLLKGKALADGKLLQEYSVKDGDTITLMVKPGADWDPSKETATPAPPPLITKTDMSTDAKPSAPGKRGHQRIPSVVLTPSPSGSPGEEKSVDIALTFDTSQIPTASETGGPPHSQYHAKISDPAFWERLYAFLRAEFPKEEDVSEAFENFLSSNKGYLSPHEIAKIRDQVGITGMAGQ
ncbi:hypothetical protein PUNSTDRAFT_113799 [Punctularia strigosozonata HHB-11173 SS5]|uniref:uncharacterized protein n=1 Tax=Punctularia strigosozonata (strain HHB-11173) TaxID=741275 RepID=UPI0004416940|nr:uncharacterized protein PUNSTDRAFT_113799 [Punctularia strigosozonata HHB-11173 SS5]EIN08213.1 hypothetical protein PUNSTDRAFT_113799 [Punctularia strigosozonata HHB-11173 SS5]